MVVSVADCERVQANWFRYRAESLQGSVTVDGPLTWTDGPDGLNLMFPTALPDAELARGVERARAAGLSIVGAWLSTDLDATPLARAGFERGWSPWWMTAPVDLIGEPDGVTASLRFGVEDDPDSDSGYRQQLAMTRLSPTRAWHAAVSSRRDARSPRRLVGHAWSFLDDDLAGVFDMVVWPRFRRRGFGTQLLRTVCSAAALAGARHAVLNATPEGKLLYQRHGFTQIGEGITWWLHLGPPSV